MYDIFLSHSSKDRERLAPLVDALEAQGWSVFWDHRAIKVADDWHTVISAAIQQCTCVIVTWSEDSITSSWVREEALIARERGVLYPIFLDMVPIPFGFTLLQAANLTQWNGDANQPEFVELKEQLSIRLNLQPVVNLKPESQPQFTPEPIPVLISEPQPKPEEKAPVRQSKPQKAVETDALPDKSGAGIKLFGSVIALAIVGVGGFQLLPKNNGKIDQPVAQTSVTHATPVGEPAKLAAAVIEPKAAHPDYEPEMVLIEEGSFMMGCDNKKETGCKGNQKPAHEVNISKFYLAKTEITVAQFRAFIEDKNYKTSAEQQGSCYSLNDKGVWGDVKGNSWKKLSFDQGDNHPVACIGYDDATAYLAWLSDKTGKTWRLPSEAEWEYAARGGTNTAYSWGNEVEKGCQFANMADQKAKTVFTSWTVVDCDDGYIYTAPVGSFKPNPLGLYDMHGNVWEWVEDKWHNNYEKAPDDGSAWISGDSSLRVLRGGSWNYSPQSLRSANRDYNTRAYRSSSFGFRPAQDYGQ